jgi:flagellar biosynthesis/type III secretory pathway M-ring protein FliF/YscJ
MTTPALPDNTGYVAAAYLVFLALILIYVVIMAARLARHARDVAELEQLADGASARDGELAPDREREIA